MSSQDTSLHPFLVKGDHETGFLFVTVFEEVVDNPKHREARGFTKPILDAIAAGIRSVSRKDLEQLLVDYYVTYPKRVAHQSGSYIRLKAVLNGNGADSMVTRKKDAVAETPSVTLKVAQRPVALEKETNALRDLEMLFHKDDSKMGYRWARTVRKYSAVYRWFATEYGLTEAHLMQLEHGQMGVPVKVHHVLMWKVQERLRHVVDPVIPLVCQYLLDHEATKPVLDGSFVLDADSLPNRNWLQAI